MIEMLREHFKTLKFKLNFLSDCEKTDGLVDYRNSIKVRIRVFHISYIDSHANGEAD